MFGNSTGTCATERIKEILITQGAKIIAWGILGCLGAFVLPEFAAASWGIAISICLFHVALGVALLIACIVSEVSRYLQEVTFSTPTKTVTNSGTIHASAPIKDSCSEARQK